MRIELQGRVSSGADNSIDDLLRIARRAAEHGLDFSTPQLFELDSLTALGIIGHELPGIRFSTAVVPIYGRHPIVMAMQALTVQAATGGRLTLGIGLSHKMLIEGAYGLSFAAPVRHMREYLEVLMPLLNQRQVTYEGQEVTTRTIAPMVVAGAVAPAVIVAALGTQMLKLTGRLADGTSLLMVGPRTLAAHVVPTITRSAESAGRPRPQIVAGIPVCVTDDPDGAREKAASEYRFYSTLPSYRAMFDIEGVEGPADIAVVGDEGAVAAQLSRFGEIGATSLRAYVFGDDEEQKRTYAVLGDLARSTRP